jgi:hypothetical protein
MNTRDPNKFCYFHHDSGHDIEECHALKNKIQRLISKEYLQQFVKKNMQFKQKERNPNDALLHLTGLF